MDGGHLLGAAGADRARPRRNKAKIVMIAVPVLAIMLVLLLTAAVFSMVSMVPDGRDQVRVLSQINLGLLLTRKALWARTPAARRYYAVGAVACFVALALKLCMIMVLCPAVVEDDA